MSPSRLAKRLARKAMVTWREQPTQHDIEALQANIRRVGLVIRVRWSLVAALAAFSVIGAYAYTFSTPPSFLMSVMRVPAGALVLVLLYNTYYTITYRRLGNIAFFNHAQLLLDAAVVTVLVYYSGGIYSWFSTMYLLFILEAAFILPRRWHVWWLAAAAAALYGGVVWAEYLGVLPHVDVPFVSNELQRNATYVSVRFFWEVTAMAGTAMVATLMTAVIRRREGELRASTIHDETTGLYNRTYFHRALRSEYERARRGRSSFSVILIDVDDFGGFNRVFGIEQGDRMLRVLADEMLSVVREADPGQVWPAATLARYGGEEFAIVLPEGEKGRPTGAASVADVAESLRSTVERARVGESSVTVSVGFATFPDDGETLDDLLNAADLALSNASRSGNSVAGGRTAARASRELGQR